MGIVHHREKNIAIYVPPKCGTQLIDKLCEFPEYGGNFYISENPQEKYKHTDYRVFIIRNHYSRVLSTYYEKVVDPHGKTVNSWRRRGYTEPEPFYGQRPMHETFRKYIHNLGQFHGKDNHVHPFLSYPWFSYNLISGTFPPGTFEKPVRCSLMFTHELDSVLRDVNEFLGLSEEDCKSVEARWAQAKKDLAGHKISYTDNLPPSELYGAPNWADVTYENLYKLYHTIGAVPSPQVMYGQDRRLHYYIKSQIGYIQDAVELGGTVSSREEQANIIKGIIHLEYA